MQQMARRYSDSFDILKACMPTHLIYASLIEIAEYPFTQSKYLVWAGVYLI